MQTSLKTILITGSSGFIGGNLVEFFRDKYKLLTPKHQELDLLSQDAVNTYFQNNQIDYVIHGANVGGNRTIDDGPDIVEKNLRMFFNIAENEENFNKMIQLGSGAEYSKEKMPPQVKESQCGRYIPKDYYGFSKYIISKYIEKNPKIYSLRLFGVFGPGEDYRYKFISNSIVKNMLGMPITIMQNVFFDWLYIQDLMYIIEYFLSNNPQKNIFNITTGKQTDILSIAQLINDFSDFKSDIILINNGFNREYSGHNHRLLSEMGHYEFMSIDDSIRLLIEYYKANFETLELDIIRKDPYASKCKIKEDKSIN